MQPAAGLNATRIAATSTAASRCGRASPGSVGVGTRRTAAQVSTPTLRTITAHAVHATARIDHQEQPPVVGTTPRGWGQRPEVHGQRLCQGDQHERDHGDEEAEHQHGQQRAHQPARVRIIEWSGHGRSPLTEWTRATSALPRTVKAGTPIRPRNTVGAEVVVVTAMPDPPSMTRASPCTPDARR